MGAGASSLFGSFSSDASQDSQQSDNDMSDHELSGNESDDTMLEDSSDDDDDDDDDVGTPCQQCSAGSVLA